MNTWVWKKEIWDLLISNDVRVEEERKRNEISNVIVI